MDLSFPTTAGDLGKQFGGAVIGDMSAPVRMVSALENAGEGSLSFFSNRKYGAALAKIKGAVLFTSPDLADPSLPLTYIVVNNPQKAFAEVAHHFRPTCPWRGISERAFVADSAELGDGVIVAPFSYVAENVRIGRGTVIHPYAYVGTGTVVGDDCQIYPRVTLMESVTIGNRVKIYPGTVVGSEGFGLVTDPAAAGLGEMPQVGTVVIEDDVRIGANCSIDRATLGETRIGSGSKLDDQVHVGHNCKIGKNCILCGHVGLAGSVVLEDQVVLAGQVGVADHVTIGKGARLGGQAGAGVDLEGGKDYLMSPAMPIGESLRVVRNLRKLSEWGDRLRRLEKTVDRLTSEGAQEK